MNESPTLDRMVAAWMADEAASTGAAGELVTDQIISATGRQRPKPRWLALLQESPMRARSQVAVGSPSYRLALVALLAVAALVAAGVAATLLLRPQTATAEWPSFRGDASHSGVGQSGPIGSPVVKWTYHAGGPLRNNVAVAGDLAFVSSEDGVLHAVGLAEGFERWSFRPGSTLTGPATANGLVIVTDGTNAVYALDAATGRERWRAADVVDGATSATVTGDRVYLGSSTGRVVALDAASGAKRWDVPASIDGDAASTPAVVDDLVYTASQSGGLVALRASDGQVAWRAATAGDPVGTAVVVGGIAYIGPANTDTPTGRLRAFDAKTGTPKWTIDQPIFSPTVAGPIGISGSSTGTISAFETVTGKERWAFHSDGVNRAPAVAGDVAYVAADGLRRIYALDVDGGGLLWRLDVDGENQCCIAVARGLVFAGTMNGTLYAVGGDGAAIAAHQTAPPPPTPTPPAASASPSPLPDPFTVVARYSQDQLGLNTPLGIAVGPSGDVYVTDVSDRVTRLDPSGGVIRRWGGTGSEHGKFDFSPASASENTHGSIAAGPDGKVYVSDFDNHRIQVFTADGEFVRQFGSFGTGPGQFQIPFDLSADADGNVYTLDDGLERLTKFSPSGDPIWMRDAHTDPPLGGFKHTAAIDPQGRIVVVQDDLAHVVYITPDGAIADQFAARGCDSTVDSAGNVYVGGCPEGPVIVYDAEHRVVAQATAEIQSPLFGPEDEVVALGWDGSVNFLKVTLPAP